jgi:hypothetical protein
MNEFKSADRLDSPESSLRQQTMRLVPASTPMLET